MPRSGAEPPVVEPPVVVVPDDEPPVEVPPVAPAPVPPPPHPINTAKATSGKKGIARIVVFRTFRFQYAGSPEELLELSLIADYGELGSFDAF